ncbi:MAG TPA: hypothetical protein VEG63_04045, partial [Candidatus Acidoferrales bacterium]|nr:hypothetical protein [Candidatus Acidoferrales bacterium]
MRSIARILTAAFGLGLSLVPALPARAQQPAAQNQAAVPKFKDPALQQYLVPEITTIEEKLDKIGARLDAVEGQLAKVKEQQQALAADIHANQEQVKATDTSVT